MKTSPVRCISLSLILGLTASSWTALAGPPPQFFQRPEQTRAASPVNGSTDLTSCPSCKVTAIETFAATNVSGKFAPHYTKVGAKHECAACGGAIVTVNGTTTNDMKANCPICAKASPTCCKL